MAFAIDAWWDERTERIEEQETVHRLTEEFRLAGERADHYVGFERRTLEHVTAVNATIQAALSSGRETVVVADSALAFVLTQGTFEPVLPTFDALRTGGRMSVLRDDELVRALSAWPAIISDAVEDQSAGREYVVNHVLPALASVSNLRNANAQILSRFGQQKLAAQTDGVTEIAVHRDMAGVIGYRVVLLTASVSELQDVREQIKSILDLLESAGG